MREKYESLSVAVLRDVAKARGLKHLSGLKKKELVELMLEEDKKDALKEDALEETEEKDASRAEKKTTDKKAADKKAEKGEEEITGAGNKGTARGEEKTAGRGKEKTVGAKAGRRREKASVAKTKKSWSFWNKVIIWNGSDF